MEQLIKDLPADYDTDTRQRLAQEITKYSERRLAVFARADAMGFPRDRVGRLHWSRIFQDMAREAGISGYTPLLQWTALSGVAHGRDYATLRFLRKTVLGSASQDERNALLELTIHEENFYVAVRMAFELLHRSWQVYDHDRLYFRESRAGPE